MDETPDHITQAPLPFGQPEEPHLSDPVRLSASTARSERNTREDHELDRLRIIYSRASSSRAQVATASRKPSGLLERVNFLIKRFWRHQISITVDHSACRDHLGTAVFHLVRGSQIEPAISVVPNEGSGIFAEVAGSHLVSRQNRFNTFICKKLHIGRVPR